MKGATEHGRAGDDRVRERVCERRTLGAWRCAEKERNHRQFCLEDEFTAALPVAMGQISR